MCMACAWLIVGQTYVLEAFAGPHACIPMCISSCVWHVHGMYRYVLEAFAGPGTQPNTCEFTIDPEQVTI